MYQEDIALVLEDTPTYKFTAYGKQGLTDLELIAIIIGNSNNTSTLNKARAVLSLCNHDLKALARLTVENLTGIPGITNRNAVSILTALELGNRKYNQSYRDRPQITSSKSIYEVMKGKLEDLNHEEFWIILLNRRNYMVDTTRLSIGGYTGTIFDIRICFEIALRKKATALILIHNHPSGNLKPSEQDIKLTRECKEAGKLLSLNVLDHIIISEQGYFSFADDGIL